MSKRDVHNLVKAKLADLANEVETTTTATRPATPMGDAGAELKRSLQTQIAELKAQLASGAVILELDPARVRPTELANRDARSLALSDEAFTTLVEDIRAVGHNRLPIEVRPAPPSSGFDFEIVSGHRRHAACRELGIKVRAVVVNSAEAPETLFQLLHRENSSRTNPSHFEYGRLYRAVLNLKVYPSQKAVAEAVGVDPSDVSLCLAILDLPPVILDAFGDPRAITLGAMKRLAKPLKERESDLLANAAAIVARGGDRPKPDQVVNELLARRAADAPEAPERDERVLRLTGSGRPTFAVIKITGWGVRLAMGDKVRDPELRKQLVDAVDRAARDVLRTYEKNR